MFTQVHTLDARRASVQAARWIAGATLALISAVTPSIAVETCSPVMEWNQFALDATVTATQGALPQIRSMAIVQTAVNDAVNAITREHDRFLQSPSSPDGGSAEASAIAAASYALTHLFPTQAAALNAKRAASLAACGLDEANAGIAVGESAAAAILMLRSTDGAAQANFPYVAPGGPGLPGLWVTVGPALPVSPGWGKVTPWVINSGSQFRPDAPPALDSGRYARDFNEAKTFGALTGSARTPEQTNIAIFWDGSPSAIWNSVARGIIAARGLDLSSTARTFALMYIAAADASIACFDAKYVYTFWRPITAIQRADEDGNDNTVPDPGWQPLITTHQHPEYPSGHSTNSSAMATALKLLFGDDPGVPIVATSPRNPTFPRHWSTLSEGVDEVIDARVYIGFHFRTADEVGARVGRQVAHFVLQHALTH